MTAAVLNGTGAGKPQKIEAVRAVPSPLASLAGPVGFALKTYAAGMLALYLSFWLGLDDPRWALLTVYVVSQPDSGMVLAKSFYRLLGTIAGLLVSIALVFTVAQQGMLFLGAMALWIGVCNFASRATRDFASYGFLLAGYSVAVVGIPAALNPNGAYPLLLARFTEIALGIGCAALVSRLVFPREIAPRLAALTRSLAARADAFAAESLEFPGKSGSVAAQWAALAKDVGAHESLRASAFFESADARLRTESAGRVRNWALALCTRAAQAAVGFSSRPGRSRSDTIRGDGVSLAVHRREAQRTEIAVARAHLAEALAAFEDGVPIANSAPPYTLSTEPLQAALGGARTVLAIAVTAGFWIATSWPSGPAAIVDAAVLCSLLAPLEQPAKITLAGAVTLILAAVPAYVTLFTLMPLAVDFPSMAVALAPILLIAGFILAQPGIGALGLLTTAYFVTSANIDNVMTYDASAFLNASLANLVGVGVALVLFATFFPDGPVQAARRFHRRLRGTLAGMADAGKPAFHAAGQSLLEPLAATLVRLKGDAHQAEACFDHTMAVLSLGNSIDRARALMHRPGVLPEIASSLGPLLDRLSTEMPLLSRTAITRCAWEARAVRRKLLALLCARAGDEDGMPFVAAAAACEMLRSDLLRVRPLLTAPAHVH